MLHDLMPRRGTRETFGNSAGGKNVDASSWVWDYGLMRVAVDAVGVRPGSAANVIENLLRAWTLATPNDEIIVLVDGPTTYSLPPVAKVHTVVAKPASIPLRLWAHSVAVRRACSHLRADALLSAVTANGFLGAPCVHAVILYDLRHELRPWQFSSWRRLGRRVLYGASFRRATAILCSSERTRGDLVKRRPGLAERAHVTLLGADHAANWRPAGVKRSAYALAFGHSVNKNVHRVLHGWHSYRARDGDLILVVCGLSGKSRRLAEQLVLELHLEASVELLPWIEDDHFHSLFAGAAAVLFPSDFEGFGLPALEAMLLGVPVVISSDPALLEVSDGHAVVAEDESPEALAEALERALKLTDEQLAAGRTHAQGFTWERTALQVREIIVRATQEG